MSIKLLPKSFLFATLFVSSQVFAGGWGENDLYKEEQKKVHIRFADIKSQNLQRDKPKHAAPEFASPFISDPEYILYEIERYNFPPVQWSEIKKSDATQVKHIKMGEWEWDHLGNDTILYTDHIHDCIGIIFKGQKSVGLAHISTDDIHFLNQGLEKLNATDEYNIYMISHYYSRHLDNIYSIIKTKFPTASIYGDISNNYMLHDQDETKEAWVMDHKWYYPYEEERFMSAENLLSRTVYVDLKTANFAKKLP